MHSTPFLTLALGALLSTGPRVTTHVQDPAVEAVPQWIWHGDATDGQSVVFRRSFRVEGQVRTATLAGSCDSHMIVLLNGEQVLDHGTWQQPVSAEVSGELVVGENLLEVRARNQTLAAGLVLRLDLGDRRNDDARHRVSKFLRILQSKASDFTDSLDRGDLPLAS